MDSWLCTKSDDLQIFKDFRLLELNYLGAEKIALCDFGDKLYGEIKTSIVWGIVRGY